MSNLDESKPYWVWGRTNKATKCNFETFEELVTACKTNLQFNHNNLYWVEMVNTYKVPYQLLMRLDDDGKYWACFGVYNFDLSKYLPHLKG